MFPTINNINTSNNETQITVEGINVSFINALRRTIISNIPIVVFKTSPYQESMVEIHENTSRLNNEIIKQRLSCIPIHITDDQVDLSDYQVELDMKNDTDTNMYVTTEHFKIKNVKTDKYLDDERVKTIFPKNSITNEYIIIARLRPSLSEDIDGEELKLIARMTYSTARENSCFNVSSNCSYRMTPDKEQQDIKWQEKERQLKSKGLTEEDIIDEKENWYNHDAKRIFKQDNFIFKLETVGVFTNEYIISKACDILKDKLAIIIQSKLDQTIKIEKSETLMKAYDITLENEDYTIGKCIEYGLYKKYFQESGHLDFVSFIKTHPHDKNSIIRLSSEDDDFTEELALNLFHDICNDCINVFDSFSQQLYTTNP